MTRVKNARKETGTPAAMGPGRHRSNYSMTRSILLVLLSAVLPATQVAGQTWCGKNYLTNESIVPPDGQFPMPSSAGSDAPLLAFRCAPAIQPYLAEDSAGSFIIDLLLTNSSITNAVPLVDRALATQSGAELLVTIAVNGTTLANGTFPLNASGHEIAVSLAGLAPQTSAFNVECTASIPGSNGQIFNASSTLLRLPDRTDGGSVTKLDGRTGAMLVKNGSSGEWETLFPLGFYTTLEGYLDTNLSVLNDLADRGINIVHPIPPFDNLTALGEVLDRMEEVGLYLMYDMRFTYMNTTSVTEEVNTIKNRPNLLLWYTGDEPDGSADPLNATLSTKALINSLDGGGYHPVSLVLNCQDYFFTQYTAGADVVMQDVYPIISNATFSVMYNTPCTEEYGDCGCDNCAGNFADITLRMDEFAFRLNALGEARSKTVWAVPQAFGAEEFWPRVPTGQEWLVSSIVSINHGAKGIVPWMDPTTPDIKDAATDLAHALPTIKSFLFDPNATFTSSRQSPFDIGIWSSEGRTLLLATNMQNVSLSQIVHVPTTATSVTVLLNSGGSFELGSANESAVSLQGLGSVAVVIQ